MADDYDPNNQGFGPHDTATRVALLSVLFHESVHATLDTFCLTCEIVDNPNFDPNQTSTTDEPQFLLVCDPAGRCFVQWNELRAYSLQNQFLRCLQQADPEMVRDCLGLGEDYEVASGHTGEQMNAMLARELDLHANASRTQFNCRRQQILKQLANGPCPRGEGVFPGGLPGMLL